MIPVALLLFVMWAVGVATVLVPLLSWGAILLAAVEGFRFGKARVVRVAADHGIGDPLTLGDEWFPLKATWWVLRVAGQRRRVDAYVSRASQRQADLHSTILRGVQDAEEKESDREALAQALPAVGVHGPSTGRILHRLRWMSPAQFEQVVAALLRLRGFTEVERTGGPGDLGVDIVCVDGAGRLVAVQCKRYRATNTIQSRHVQLFVGMAFTHHQCDRAIYVCTSKFTPAARKLAATHGIETVDGAELARILAEGSDYDGPHLASGAVVDEASPADLQFLTEHGIQLG